LTYEPKIQILGMCRRETVIRFRLRLPNLNVYKKSSRAAEGIIAATEKCDKPAPVNLGSGKEITIKQLVDLVAKLTGFKEVVWGRFKA
jgi:nucleoside-diphosphate-sugar epimerase